MILGQGGNVIGGWWRLATPPATPDTQPNNVGPQGAGQRTIFLPAARRGLALWPDEEFVSAVAPSALEEDTFIPGVRAGAFVPPQAVFLDEVEEWIASIPVDDDYSYVGPYRGYPPARVFVGDDDAWIASIAVDEDGAIAVMPARGAQRIVSPPWEDSDFVAPAAFVLDEDGVQIPLFGYAPAPRPFLGDEEWPSSISIDDEYFIAGRYRGYAPASIFVGDDDAWIASIAVDDDGLIAVPLIRGWQRSALPWWDDSDFVAPATFVLDDEPWILAGPRWVRAPSSAFLGDEDLAPAILDEDGWWIVAPRQAPMLRFAIHDAEMLAIAVGLASDPRYVVHLAGRGFSGAQGARKFDIAMGARKFASSATARSFGVAEGSRKFVVTWKNPRT